MVLPVNRALDDVIDHADINAIALAVNDNTDFHNFPIGIDETRTDNQTPINAALALGSVMLPPGVFQFSGEINIPAPHGLIGSGNGEAVAGTTLKAVTAAAKMSVGSMTGATNGARVGGFRLDGNETATGVSDGFFSVDFCVHRSFKDLSITDVAVGGTAMKIRKSQNCSFENVNVVRCGGKGVHLTDGCGGLAFHRCEINAIGNMHLLIDQENVTGDVYPYPSHIKFDSCVIERDFEGVAAGVVRVDAAEQIIFDNCTFALNNLTSSPTELIKMNTGVRIVLRDVRLYGESDFDGIHQVSGTQVDSYGFLIATGTLNSVWRYEAGVGSYQRMLASSGIPRFSGAGATGTRPKSVLDAGLDVRGNADDPFLLRMAPDTESVTGWRWMVTSTMFKGSFPASFVATAELETTANGFKSNTPFLFADDVGFYGTTPIAKQTGVGTDAASIHAALVSLGLIA